MEERTSLPKKALNVVFSAIAVCFICFHLYTSYFGVLPGNAQKGVHLAFVLAVCFLSDLLNDKKKLWEKITAVISMVMGLTGVLYIVLNYEAMNLRGGIILDIDKV
ncbi:MAG: hypothetical protein MJ171_06570, partial [Clostridia bacterium]|nr:hypothetical protein [Clostridia bacterium]